MTLPRRQFLQLAVGAAALPSMLQIAKAQSYPSRPVRMLVGFAAGGSSDIVARLTGQWLAERLGQPFLVENRIGAGTNLATEAVVRAPADGYTLLLATVSNAINATLYEKLSFNFIRDIAAVAALSQEPNVMLVHPSVPAKTVPEFIAYAAANPGKVVMASGGHGAPSHASGELFKMMTGVNMLHVPYRGGAPALTGILAGQVNVYFSPMIASIEHIKVSKLRALAVKPPPPARKRCRTYRPWPISSRATRRAPGWESARPRTRPPKSSISSTRRSTRCSPIPDSRCGLPTRAAFCSPERPPTSGSSSPTKPRSGAR